MPELFIAADDPELDATEGAHPAWWRGHDAGAAGVVKALAALLDHPEIAGADFTSPELTELGRRIIGMRNAMREFMAGVRAASNILKAERDEARGLVKSLIDACPSLDPVDVDRILQIMRGWNG